MTILPKQKQGLTSRCSILMKLTLSVAMLSFAVARGETIPQLEYRCKDAKAALKIAEKAFGRAQDAVEDAKDALEDDQDAVKDLNADLAKLKAKYEKAAENAKQDLAKDIAKVEAKLAQANAKAASSEQAVTAATSKANAAKAELDKAEAARSDLELKLVEARKNAPDIVAKAALAEAKAALKAADKQRDDAADLKADSEKKLAKANAKLAEAETALKDAKEKSDLKTFKEAQDTRDQMASTIATLKNVADEAQAKFDAADKAYKDAEIAIKTAEENIEKAKATMKADQAAADAEANALAAQKKNEAAPAPAAAVAAAPAADAPAAEYKAPWTPAPERELPALRGGQRLTVPEAQDADIADEAAILPEFDVTMVSGDKDVVENLQIWKDWSAYVVFNKVTPKQVNEFHGQLLKALREEGYVFAQVSFPTRIWSTGIFLAKVDLGMLGEITVKNQKHYSPEQIAAALRSKEGRFNYNKVNRDLFDLNIKPDLKLNTQLSTSMLNGRRVINADIEVKDSLPVHGAIELSNTGSKVSNSDWRLRTTLQHLNLTKHGDALTIDWLTGFDIGKDVNAYTGSYFLPLGTEDHINVFGGYNHNDLDDVMPELDVRGRGTFFGFSWTHTIYENVKERVELSLGWFYQRHENFEVFDDIRYEDGNLAVSMPTVSLGYSSKVFDNFNGRNFASLSFKQNKAGTFFGSSQHKFEKAWDVDGDFLIANLQMARFQRLFAGENHPGKWTLYAKTNTQLSSDHLPSNMREYLGGMNTIRGYEESEIGGDHSFAATLELRTPLLEDFIPGLKQDDPEFREKYPEHWSQHRLQFVAFSDFGYVREKDKKTSQDDTTLWSVGAGIRLGLTKYSQMAVDYGYPLLKSTHETPSSGRFHMSLQLQF